VAVGRIKQIQCHSLKESNKNEEQEASKKEKT